MKSLIQCKNVSLAYENKIIAENINFDINEGDYITVLGENGSGKSTLIKAILGLVKINSGDITFGEGLRKNEIGYLPQQSGLQRDFPASCKEIILSGSTGKMGAYPFIRSKEKEKAEKIMKLLRIDSLKDVCFKELSGGQQQKILLARALLASEKIIFMDEPTSGLDAASTVDFYGLIKTLNEQCGMTVVMISHDITASIKDSTHILYLNKKQAFFGTKQDFSLRTNNYPGGNI